VAAGNPSDEVRTAWLANGRLREGCATVDFGHAQQLLTVFDQWCVDAEVPT
jgi:hypothetical protein